jgi:uncharacterized protein (DUF3820 family)
MPDKQCPRCSSREFVKDLTKMSAKIYYFKVYCAICFEFMGQEMCDFDEKKCESAVMKFGKHKNQPLNDIPIEYLRWVKETCQPSQELAVAIGYQFVKRGAPLVLTVPHHAGN